jgi:hypothetical protein
MIAPGTQGVSQVAAQSRHATSLAHCSWRGKVGQTIVFLSSVNIPAFAGQA